MDLMVSFSMKYFNWTSSYFSFLAACLRVGKHDIGRLNTLDRRDGQELHTRRVFRPLTDEKFSWIDLEAISLGQYV